MSLTSKQRADLRGEAHHLSPLVHIGHLGLTETLIDALDDALRTKELVKCAIGKNSDVKAKQVANDVAERVGADVVQVIGKTFTLYRENTELHRKGEILPPWRR